MVQVNDVLLAAIKDEFPLVYSECSDGPLQGKGDAAFPTSCTYILALVCDGFRMVA